MATPTSQLEAIAKLIEGLAPLGGKQRGMRIEADEWNLLVGTLRDTLEIDRTQETTTRLLLEGSFATREHEHLGEVDLAWFDAVLQERLADGVGGSLSVRTLVTNLAKRMDAAAAEVARLTAIVEAQQQRNDKASVDELERAAKLRGFEDRFKGVEDLRAVVTRLERRVNELEPAIDTVLELREILRDDTGAPLDLQQLVRDVNQQQKLLANLNGIDGKPVRLRDIELDIRELKDILGLVGSGGLEGRFATLGAQLTDTLGGTITERIDAARAELAAANETLATELRGELDGRVTDALGAAGQTTTTRIAEAEARIAASLDSGLRDTAESLRTELTALVANGVAQTVAGVGAAVDTGVAAAEQRLAGVIDARAAETRATLEQVLGERLDTRVGAVVAEALGDVDQRIDGRLRDRLEELLVTVDDRVRAVVDERLAGVPATVAKAMDERLAELDLPGQFKDLGGRLREELRGDMTVLQRGLEQMDERLRRLGG